MVESIVKTANISAGDVVYGADESVPYAIPIGEVADVALAQNSLFKEASLSFPYDMGTIQTVEIVKQ
jgi:cell shape-determining protein MreC